MPTSRRDVLAGAAGLAAASVLPAPVIALAPPPVRPCALLLEHRRRAAQVVAIEAVDAFEPLYELEAAGLLPSGMSSDEIAAMVDQYTSPRTAAVEAHSRALAPVARSIWATPASTWEDIVDRAELAKFWNRHGLGYADHHGYDDIHAEMRLIDAVRVVALRPTAQDFPAFDPPPALLEWRRLHAEEHGLYALRDLTADESERYRSARFHLEFRRLLKEPADSSTWGDVVVRAELMGRRNSSCWLKDNEGFHCEHRAFAELLTAILRLGNCPPPMDSHDIWWERMNRPAVEKHRAKTRVYHAEVTARRKDWLTLNRA